MAFWELWLVVGVVLLIIELFTQAVWTICVAAGCVAALGAYLLGASLAVQLLVLAVFSVVSFFVLSPILGRFYNRASKKKRLEMATGMDALIGRKAFVTKEIKPGKPGRVQIDGDNWQAMSATEAEELQRGEPVEVEGHESIILIVKRIKE